jgi:hypothetical protein
MNELRERVARAIGQHVHIISGSCDLEAAVRDAIGAMREPTNAMGEVGFKHGDNPFKTWSAMIDEALK